MSNIVNEGQEILVEVDYYYVKCQFYDHNERRIWFTWDKYKNLERLMGKVLRTNLINLLQVLMIGY